MGDERIATGLADAVEALRESSRPWNGAQIGRLGETKLEVELAITNECGVDGGIRFRVVSFGAKAGRSLGHTHRLTLALQPMLLDANGTPTPALIARRVTGEPK